MSNKQALDPVEGEIYEDYQGKHYRYSRERGFVPWNKEKKTWAPGSARLSITPKKGFFAVPTKSGAKKKESGEQQPEELLSEATVALRKEKEDLEREIENKKELARMLGPAPTNRELVHAARNMFEENGFHPLRELMEIAQDKEALSIKDRVNLLKNLAEFVTPKPKSMDIDANISGGVTVQTIDFSNITQKTLEKLHRRKKFTDEDYDEFMEAEEV